MAETKEDIEEELANYKQRHPDWEDNEGKLAYVTSVNNRLAKFTGNNSVAFIM